MRNNRFSPERIRIRNAAAIALIVAAAILLSGCAAMRPVEDTGRQYVFNPDPYEPVEPEPATERLFVAIERVNVPHYLEPSGIAVREEGQHLRYSFNHRWAEPLQSGLNRLLVENLEQEGFIEGVARHPGELRDPENVEIRVSLRRCEGAISEATAHGVFRAAWEGRRHGDGTLLFRGNTIANDLEWDGSDYPLLVSGLNDAANRLAREIAGELHDLAAGQPEGANEK